MSLTKEDAAKLWSVYKDDFLAAVDQTDTLNSPKSIFEITQVLKDGFLGAVFGIGLFIALALTSLLFYWWYYSRTNTEMTYLLNLKEKAMRKLKTGISASTFPSYNLNETASIFTKFIQQEGIVTIQPFKITYDTKGTPTRVVETKQVDLKEEKYGNILQDMNAYVSMHPTAIETKTRKLEWSSRVINFMIVAFIISLVLGLVILFKNKVLVEKVRNSYEKNQIGVVWEQFPEVIKASPIYEQDQYVSAKCMVLENF
jgi:hypothetical protein